MSKPQMVQSVTRAVGLLLALERGPRSLAGLVEATGLSKATAHRLLASLSFGQLVIQDPITAEYLLGPGCFGIGDAVLRGFGGLDVIANPVLERLLEETGETVALHVRIGLLRICVGQLPSPQPVRYVARVGAAQPLYVGGAGKVILAFSQEDVRKEILDRIELKPVTDSTIIDRTILDREINQIRNDGYATSHGENVVGGMSVSVPVLGEDGGIVAALSVIGPDARLSESNIDALISSLLRAADEIAALLSRAGSNAQSIQPA